MKKIYFLGLMSAALAVNAQMPQTRTGNEVRQATVKKEVKTDVVVPIVANVTTPSQKALGKAGAVAFNDKVGTTFAINQTNGATYRRVIVYPDGKVSMTWTASIDCSRSCTNKNRIFPNTFLWRNKPSKICKMMFEQSTKSPSPSFATLHKNKPNFVPRKSPCFDGA